MKQRTPIVHSHITFTPVASSNYTWSTDPQSPTQVGGGSRRQYFPVNGIVRFCQISTKTVNGKTSPSSDLATLAIRINNTTDYTISASVDYTGGGTTIRTYSVSNLAIQVTTADYFEIKLTTPAWITPPLNLTHTGTLLIDSF